MSTTIPDPTGDHRRERLGLPHRPLDRGRGRSCRHVGPNRPRLQPRHRPADRRGRFRLCRGDRRGGRGREGRLPGLAGALARRGAPSSCSRSASSWTRTATDIARFLTAEHGKVPSDALGEVARGLEVIEYACGIPTLLKGELLRSRRRPASTSTRSASRSESWPASRRSTSRRWSRCAMWAPALACGNCFVPEALRRRIRARRSRRARCCKEAGVPDGVFSGRQRRQGRGRAGCSSTPTSPPSRSSAPLRSPARSTRTGRRTASACRRSAGRRTTWSSSRMPTSTWPRMPLSALRTARPASAAWRSRSSSPSATSPTRSSTRSRTASPR